MQLYFLLLLIVSTLTLSSPASADQWTYFHPGSVTKLSCKAEAISLVVNGTRKEGFTAEAVAERSDKELGEWEMSLGFFQGKHAAQKAADLCGKWVEEADKRIRQAKGIKESK